MDEHYLAKWLSGELSGKELETFRKSPDFGLYERIVSASGSLEAPDFDIEAALERAKSARQPSRVIRMHPARRWMQYAAAAVMVLGLAYFILRDGRTSVEASYAQRQEVVLPDASQIVLNAGSEVAYSESGWNRNRNIRLQGEAFFKVAKGKAFTVETEVGSVTVLGTQFNVLQRGSVFIVSCYEGLVRVEHQGDKVELPAGTRYRIVGGKAESPEPVEGSAPSWTRDTSAFRSMPLSFVIGEFERQFDMEVETRGFDTGLRFSGTFSNTDLDLALQSISAPLQLKYEVSGNKVLFYAEDRP